MNEGVRYTPLSHEDIEWITLQEFVGVFRRGGCHQLEAGELDRQGEAESVGKGVKLTHLDYPLLPALAIGLGAIRGVGHHT